MINSTNPQDRDYYDVSFRDFFKTQRADVNCLSSSNQKMQEAGFKLRWSVSESVVSSCSPNSGEQGSQLRG